jgi:serine/threonine protein kinase
LDISINEDGEKEINQYQIIGLLGKGAQGVVKKAKNKNDGKYYAIKILKSRNIGNMAEFRREIAIKRKLCHQNTIYLYEVIENEKKKKFYLVIDLMDIGPMLDKKFWKYEKRKNPQSDGKKLSEQRALFYFRQLVEGVDYLHNAVNVAHKDIKPDNLLIDSLDRLKISDFGASSLMSGEGKEGKANVRAGTKAFQPPELLMYDKAKEVDAKSSDIWAMGVCLYLWLYGTYPFKIGQGLQALKESIMKGE